MPHGTPDPRRFSAYGDRQHHIVLAKVNRLQVGNAALVACRIVVRRDGNHRGFTRGILIRRLFRHTAGRPRANHNQTPPVAQGRGGVIHHTGNNG